MSNENESWIVFNSITHDAYGQYCSMDEARKEAAVLYNVTGDSGWTWRKADPIKESIEEMSKPENNHNIPE